MLSNESKKKIYTHTIVQEAELLQQMSNGDISAFNTLFAHFQPKVYSYILPFTNNTVIDANDIVQDIFVKLWMKKEALATLQSLEYYLYRMARNRLIDLKRSTDVQQGHYQQFGSNQVVQAETTLYDVQYREFEKRAKEAIHKLPKRRREIFDLSINKDLSLAEIAETLHLSISVVKKQLYLASNAVRETINNSKVLLSLILFSKILGL